MLGREVYRLATPLAIATLGCSSAAGDTPIDPHCDAASICFNGCTNLQSDPENCGACGRICAITETCTAGRCEPFCPSGLTLCGATCRDLRSDLTNCGACGATCSTSCSGGVCAGPCAGGTTLCGDACRALDHDPSHCGACDTVCPADARCEAGACVCPAGKVQCGTRCVDPSSDPENCGGCGVVCGSGKCVTADLTSGGAGGACVVPEVLSGNCFVAKVGAERRAYCWGEGPRGNFEPPVVSGTRTFYPPRRVLDHPSAGPIDPTGSVALTVGPTLAMVTEPYKGRYRDTIWWVDSIPKLWGYDVAYGRRPLFDDRTLRQILLDANVQCITHSRVECVRLGPDFITSPVASPPVPFVPGTACFRSGVVGASEVCGLVDSATSVPAQYIRCWRFGAPEVTSFDSLDTKSVELVSTENKVFCARQAGGTVQCVGDGYLGDGLPPHVGIGTLPRKLSKLDASGCGISEGDVYCWGPNKSGAVGDGTTTPQPTLTKVALPGKARLLSGTTAVLEDGAVYLWGPDAAKAPPPKGTTSPALKPIRLEWY